MKYLHNVTAPVLTSINADGLRGEGRWERNAFEAFVLSGRQVHSTTEIWRADIEKPSNFHDGLNPDWQDDSILITYGVPQNIGITAKAKYYMVQFLDDPFDYTVEKFNSYLREKPKSIVATCSFKTWVYLSRIQKTLGTENVEYLPRAAVPCVVGGADNFDKPNLFWAYRNFWEYAVNRPAELGRLLDKVIDFFERDASLKLVLFPAPQDPVYIFDQPLCRQWIFSQPFAQRLKKYEDRVEVVPWAHWHEMLAIFSQTRLVISPPLALGGTLCEAAMYGIPSMVRNDTSQFLNSDRSPFFPELLTVPEGVNDSFLGYLERLFSDRAFYRKHGDAYRNYVGANNTYEAYIRNLDVIVKNRGWA